jgi:hypothetical protein
MVILGWIKKYPFYLGPFLQKSAQHQLNYKYCSRKNWTEFKHKFYGNNR